MKVIKPTAEELEHELDLYKVNGVCADAYPVLLYLMLRLTQLEKSGVVLPPQLVEMQQTAREFVKAWERSYTGRERLALRRAARLQLKAQLDEHRKRKGNA